MRAAVENLTDTVKLELKRFCLPGIFVTINFIIKLLPSEKNSYKTADISNSWEKYIIYLTS